MLGCGVVECLWVYDVVCVRYDGAVVTCVEGFGIMLCVREL